MGNDYTYKIIFDTLPYGIFYFDDKGVIIDCNQTFLDSVNSTKELMIGFDTINRLQNKGVIQGIVDCINTGNGYYEGPYTSVTGKKAIISKGIFKAVYNKDGSFKFGVCTLEDITIQHDQKQKLIDLNNEYATLNEAFLEQNEELQQVNQEINDKNKSLELEKIKNIELIKSLSVTEKNYRTIFYNSPIPMIVHLRGIIVLINDAALIFANITNADAVLGKPVLNFVHESSVEAAKNNIAKVMQGEATEMEEEKFLTFDGKVKDVMVNASQFSYNGEVALLVAFADITEINESKYKLEKINEYLNDKNTLLEEETAKNEEILYQLEIAEQNYRNMFDSSPVPMVIHHQGDTLLYNTAMEHLLEVPNSVSFIGKDIFQFVQNDFIDLAKKEIAKVSTSKDKRPKEIKFISYKGKVLDVLVRSSPFIFNKKTTILTALTDITEIKISKIKLEELNKELNNRNDKLKEETLKNKEILQKLAEAEDNYETIFNNSPNPILVHQDGKFVYLNDATIEFAQGGTKEDYIGTSIANFIHPDSMDRAMKNIQKALRGDETSLIEEKFINSKGEARDVLTKTGLYKYNNKMAALVSFVDITEMKLVEEKVRLISKGIDTSPASIVITDIKGDVQFVNPKFIEITGYSEQEILGKNPRVLKSGKHSAKFYKEMWRSISRGKSWRGEIQNKKKNGNLFWEYAIISPIFDDKNEITHYIAIKEDITRRKEIEQKLLTNEKHFKTLYDTAPDGIFEIDENGVIINCNIEFANSVKLRKSQLIGKKASDFINNKDLFKRLLDQLIKRGFVESEIVQKNGDGTSTIVWRKVTAIYDKDENFIGAIAYNREITEIKEVENQLIEAKERAEEADNLKTAFLSNMSHEIRTPLNAIVGFTELLSKKEIQKVDREKYSNYIKHNSKLLLNLINDIVDVSKIEANQIKISKKPTEIKSVFNELYQIFSKENAVNPNVDLKLEIIEDAIILDTDEFRLRQIITNLISNAIKFTDDGEISFGYYIENNKLVIFVKDTGEGINKEFVSKIFTRFFKLGALTNNKSGTGLGLSIVKSLTELLDGEITVISEKYIGTEFKITFPYDINLSVLNERKNDDYDLSSFDWSSKTILIAEDDEFNFIVLEEYLKISNLNIIHAKDGAEAVDLFKENKNKIDIILMDIQMPKLDGYSSAKEILKIDENAKIIAQTAFAMSDERDKSLEVGCIDYITKPIDISVLTLLLANYLR